MLILYTGFSASLSCFLWLVKGQLVYKERGKEVHTNHSGSVTARRYMYVHVGVVLNFKFYTDNKACPNLELASFPGRALSL